MPQTDGAETRPGRVLYIDSLRVLAVLLLIPFHSARLFDVWEPFYAKNAQTSMVLSIFIGVVNAFHMPLLFLLAGASTYFALAKRGSARYVGERALRLLVPFAFGVAVLIPPQSWFGARQNVEGFSQAYLPYWRGFFAWDTSVSDYFGGSGFGHLWFVLFLFIIAVITLPLLRWFGCERGRVCTGWLAGRPKLTLLAFGMFALFLAAFSPNPFGHDMASYVVYFTLGYLMAQEERLAAWTQPNRWWMLGLGIVLMVPVAFLADYLDAGFSPKAVAAGFSYMLCGLLLTLAMVGLGRAYLDRPYRWLPYASEASYPFYIWHQTVIVVAGFYIVRLSLGVWPEWVLVMAAGFIGSLALYEVVRRTAPTRFLFGMRRAPKAA